MYKNKETGEVVRELSDADLDDYYSQWEEVVRSNTVAEMITHGPWMTMDQVKKEEKEK